MRMFFNVMIATTLKSILNWGGPEFLTWDFMAWFEFAKEVFKF